MSDESIDRRMMDADRTIVTQDRTIHDLRVQLATIEQKYRKLLWLGHGHIGLYGDDGEMQCAMCGAKYRVWDYKREPLEAVERAAMAANQERVAEVIAAQFAKDKS